MIFSKNSSDSNIGDCSTILNIRRSETFGKYLGFPIFNQRPPNTDFRFILDNMNNKLAGWENPYVEYGRKMRTWQIILK